MNRFNIYVHITIVICNILFVSCAKRKEHEKPNFILILTDDQGYNDLGCFGSPLIRTPHIDQLAEEGIRLTNFYTQPICGPSRTALLTGCYPLRVAEVGNSKRLHPMVHPDEILLPEILGEVGYKTGCIGKWDINGHRNNFEREDLYPTRMGFDYWFGLPSSNDRGVKVIYKNEKIIKSDITIDTLTQVYTSEALQFIDKNKDRPFFLYIAHNMPHTRLGASHRFKGKSHMGLYGDAIEEIDYSVGKIKEKITELGLDRNTIMIYTSDNGPWWARGTHGGSAFPLRGGKASTWEGGVRVPCIFWSDGILKSGEVFDKVTSTMDILPTLTKLAGAEIPKNHIVDGKEISTHLTVNGENTPFDETYYYFYHTHLQAVRSGDWKLVLPRPQAPEWVQNNKKSIWRYEDMEPVRDVELYNLKTDISERRDVAGLYPEKVKKLMLLIDEARIEIGDFNVIGKRARFYDHGRKRPDVDRWKMKDNEEEKQELHPFYDDGGRNL